MAMVDESSTNLDATFSQDSAIYSDKETVEAVGFARAEDGSGEVCFDYSARAIMILMCSDRVHDCCRKNTMTVAWKTPQTIQASRFSTLQAFTKNFDSASGGM